MDSTLKQRLIGAAVLAALAIIFLPMLLKGPDVREPDAAEVPLAMPAAPGQDYETRELPLTEPEGTRSPGGVLGMAQSPAAPVSPDRAELPISTAPDSTTAVPLATHPDATVAPAVVAPAPVPAAAAAIAAGNYMVNIGTFSNLDNANALVAKLRGAKLLVTTDRAQLATGSAMRIRVGPYDDRAAAEAARLTSESVAGTSAKVVVLDAGNEAATPAAPKPAAAAVIPPPTTLAASPKPAMAPASPKPVPATAPATPKPAPGIIAAGYAVQLSAPSVEADALALRDRARGLGFNSFVQRVETDSGVRFRVRVGPVADRSAAETMRESVNGKLGTKGIIVANP